MPPIEPILGHNINRVKWSEKTSGGDFRGWLDPNDTSLNTRRVLSKYDTRYRVAVGAFSQGNVKLVHELIGPICRERHTIHVPTTLTTLLRAAQNIRGGEQDSIVRTREQIELLNRVMTALSAWQVQPQMLIDLYKAQLEVLESRLKRSDTSRRRMADARLAKYKDFSDSLGRQNPLISGTQFRIISALLLAQLEVDESMDEAANRRIDFAVDLWRRTSRRIAEVLELAESNSESKLSVFLPYMEDLQIKPFSFATSFILWDRRHEDDQLAGTATAIERAYTVELSLAELDHIFSLIKNNPEALDRVSMERVEAALPAMAFAPAYGRLAEEIGLQLNAVFGHFCGQNFEMVASGALQLQMMLRYRRGRLNRRNMADRPIDSTLAYWDAGHILAGERIAEPSVGNKARS